MLELLFVTLTFVDRSFLEFRRGAVRLERMMDVVQEVLDKPSVPAGPLTKTNQEVQP